MGVLDSSPPGLASPGLASWTRLDSFHLDSFHCSGFGERVCLTIDALFDEWDK